MNTHEKDTDTRIPISIDMIKTCVVKSNILNKASLQATRLYAIFTAIQDNAEYGYIDRSQEELADIMKICKRTIHRSVAELQFMNELWVARKKVKEIGKLKGTRQLYFVHYNDYIRFLKENPSFKPLKRKNNQDPRERDRKKAEEYRKTRFEETALAIKNPVSQSQNSDLREYVKQFFSRNPKLFEIVLNSCEEDFLIFAIRSGIFEKAKQKENPAAYLKKCLITDRRLLDKYHLSTPITKNSNIPNEIAESLKKIHIETFFEINQFIIFANQNKIARIKEFILFCEKIIPANTQWDKIKNKWFFIKSEIEKKNIVATWEKELEKIQQKEKNEEGERKRRQDPVWKNLEQNLKGVRIEEQIKNYEKIKSGQKTYEEIIEEYNNEYISVVNSFQQFRDKEVKNQTTRMKEAKIRQEREQYKQKAISVILIEMMEKGIDKKKITLEKERLMGLPVEDFLKRASEDSGEESLLHS